MTECNMIQALNQALHQAFAADETLLLFGEDCGAFGGVFRVSLGLQETFGELRCFDSPLSEQGIIGFAVGVAQRGLRPICEIQFADYIFPAYDQIVNEVAKMRYRTGGQYSCPMVIRSPCGGGIHGGHYHSQSPEAHFLHTPGLCILTPSSPYDAKGLLLSALSYQDPVLFFEPKRIYRSIKEEVPEEWYETPIGKAQLARSGSDLTLIGWGAQHHQNLEAAAIASRQYGIEAELLNLRSLAPLDRGAIIRSVVKTGRCLIAHEAPYTMGFGAELAAMISQECFYHLKAPVKRCCGWDTPFPNTLESLYLPDAERVLADLIRLINE